MCRPLVVDEAEATLAELQLTKRPNPRPQETIRLSADLVKRNIKPLSAAAIRGNWTAKVSEAPPPARWAMMVKPKPSVSAISKAPEAPQTEAPRGLAGGPAPTRSFRNPNAAALSGWTSKLTGSNSGKREFIPTTPNIPGEVMAKALQTRDASGFKRRSGLPIPQQLNRPATESALMQVVNSTYRQLLNKLPLDSERLISAESKLRDEQIDLGEFVQEVALSDAFQSRLASMAPLRAASAAALSLLGRAATADEVTRFLNTRALSGQHVAVKNLLASRTDTDDEPNNNVPRIDGMETQLGLPQSTAQRTASLYRGNAGLNPPQGPSD
jgi:phycobilisome core-membrane linker protein